MKVRNTQNKLMLNIKNRKTPEIIAEFSGFLLLQGSIKVTIIEYLKKYIIK